MGTKWAMKRDSTQYKRFERTENIEVNRKSRES